MVIAGNKVSLPKVFTSKRQRFVITSILATWLLIGATLPSLEWRYRFIVALGLVLGGLTIWSLGEG